MRWILSANEIYSQPQLKVGGKATALSLLHDNGVTIPDTLCISGDVYKAYVEQTGLRERISLELNRKAFSQMRWEEIWDCATRIRSLFVRKVFPSTINKELSASIERKFGNKPVAVRSSALDEDGTEASFAGLHESFININGVDAILKHIRLVYASLWSDAALLYRQEIGLSVEKSAMAVVIQEVIVGECSGIAFTQSPTAKNQGIVESVHGLNQGLVDGDIEPDRWILDRKTYNILSHAPALREHWVHPCDEGVCKNPLPSNLMQKAPLTHEGVKSVFTVAMQTEKLFNSPQDVEWTIRGDSIYLLQARPITTLNSGAKEDNRSWYLTLHRSFENLKALRKRIENEFIPAMIREAERLSELNLENLSAVDLAEEIKKRWKINHKWVNIYWEEFIPFAHGVRLFGQFYNDIIQPEDPYEFIDLLSNTQMVSMRRNLMLEELADLIRHDPNIEKKIRNGKPIGDASDFNQKVEAFVRDFGDLSCSVTGGTQCIQEKTVLFNILLEMAANPTAPTARIRPNRNEELKNSFFANVKKDQRTLAVDMLELARASYQLRDDDNIYLGRIESQLLAATQVARRKLSDLQDDKDRKNGNIQVLSEVLADLGQTETPIESGNESAALDSDIKPRQLIGQPAGPGIAKGRAYVIHDHSDLAHFRHGDIMFCDAVDPNMTFVVPLASAVVERRGGMLIHGAIIAREYGLPCVTGIPDATTLVRTGEEVTVDGYLGIVTVGSGDI